MIQQKAQGRVEVHLTDGSVITCQSRADAELVLDAARRFYEGDTGRKLPQETLAALERAGLNAANSPLYGSAIRHVAEELGQRRTKRLKLVGAAILVFHASTSLQAAPASLALAFGG
jgi:hypothetical protein